MGRIADVQTVPIKDLRAYERNAKIHNRSQVEKIAASIEEFGFLSPCLIDRDMNIIAGHGRVMAAELLNIDAVPCVFIDGLTEEQRRAYILADNRLGDLAEWDMGIVTEELEELLSEDFEIELTGFELPDNADWFSERQRYDNDNDENESEEYQDFLEKFEQKRTTDDCYTPDEVYEAIAEWVAKEYNLDRKTFHRPFYPGGDYQAENYAGRIVVDNPPFSILSEILQFYNEHNVRFFLFAPTLTLFSSSSSSSTALPIGAAVTYENGAMVNTSFLTNLEDRTIRVKSSPELYQVLKAANEQSVAARGKREIPKYSYPDEVITSAGVAKYSKYGINFQVTVAESEGVSTLDAQKESGKAIYGKGYLISEKAAAEKAAAEKAAAEKAAAEKAAAEKAAATRWPLSDREREIVRRLSENE